MLLKQGEPRGVIIGVWNLNELANIKRDFTIPEISAENFKSVIIIEKMSILQELAPYLMAEDLLVNTLFLTVFFRRLQLVLYLIFRAEESHAIAQ